ncbi:MAG: hypothetical protein NT018_14670 [Armatimonadetes bacterium]|nr:hypothetical protein [Armatimonadota bacterium]
MRVRRQCVCAAFALVCTMMHASAAWGVYDQQFINQSDFMEGKLEGVTFQSEISGMSLSECTFVTPTVWAPSSVEGMVSKIDPRNGRESARYRVGPDADPWAPTSVTSDGDGNAYIACAADGQPGKIVLIVTKGGIDRNRDGIISTCGDYDANAAITPSEVFAWGADEKVGFVCNIGLPGTTPSAILYDDGYLWVCLQEECRVVKIDIKTAKVAAVMDVVGKPTNIVKGLNGSLWVLSNQYNILTELNIIMNRVESKTNLEFSAGGMVIESNGALWIGNLDGGLACLQTTTGAWKFYTSKNNHGIAGVTVAANGDIWGACPKAGAVIRFNCEDGAEISEVQFGKAASSVCADADGYIWALCDGDTGAMKIDARSGKAPVFVQTAAEPFSSTPFASRITDKGFLPTGSWSAILEGEIDGAGWGGVTWNSADNGGTVKMLVRVADTPEKLLAQTFKQVMNGKRFGGPNGRFIEIKMILDGPGNMTPVISCLRVEGTNLAPDVSNAAVTIPRIGRLDHVMESVRVYGVTDPEGDPFKIIVTGVTQDEPVMGLDPDDKAADAILTGGDNVWLRGECAPGTPEKPAKGRTYTVAFKAVDELGAESTGKLKVTVAPNIKPSTVVVEGKSIYDSTKEPLKQIAKAE